MSRIAAIDPTTTSGRINELLSGVHKGLGVTPNLFRVAAQSHAALEGLVGLNVALSKGKLGARLRESLALTVAEIDGCDYCLSAHTALGKGAGLSEEELSQAREGRAVDPRSAAILRFARLVTEKRGNVGEEELAIVRRAGASDGEILEIIAHVALNVFTNYVNVVAGTEIDFPVVRHHPR